MVGVLADLGIYQIYTYTPIYPLHLEHRVLDNILKHSDGTGLEREATNRIKAT